MRECAANHEPDVDDVTFPAGLIAQIETRGAEIRPLHRRLPDIARVALHLPDQANVLGRIEAFDLPNQFAIRTRHEGVFGKPEKNSVIRLGGPDFQHIRRGLPLTARHHHLFAPPEQRRISRA